MTCDTWWGWTLSQNFSSLALTFWDWQGLKDSEQKDDLISELINEWQWSFNNTDKNITLNAKFSLLIEGNTDNEVTQPSPRLLWTSCSRTPGSLYWGMYRGEGRQLLLTGDTWNMTPWYLTADTWLHDTETLHHDTLYIIPWQMTTWHMTTWHMK